VGSPGVQLLAEVRTQPVWGDGANTVRAYSCGAQRDTHRDTNRACMLRGRHLWRAAHRRQRIVWCKAFGQPEVCDLDLRVLRGVHHEHVLQLQVPVDDACTDFAADEQRRSSLADVISVAAWQQMGLAVVLLPQWP